MQRKQFTFYRSFYSAIQQLSKESDQLLAYKTVCRYALDGIAPDIDALPNEVSILFILMKPNLDSARRKAAAGRKGGLAQNLPWEAPARISGESGPEAN